MPLRAVMHLCLVSWLSWASFCWAQGTLRVGVLAYRPVEQTRAQWLPTIEYLQKALPGYRLELEPMSFGDLDKAARDGHLAFVLTNPEHYVLLRSSRPLSAVATLMPLAEGHPVSAFGGVLIRRADRADIRVLEEVKGKTVAATTPGSFGGYLMQSWLLKKNNIDIAEGDARMLFTGMPHDKVVAAVLDGKADVGFVRTGVIESMLREGRLSRGEIELINEQLNPRYPQRRSTELYPEWPFVVDQSVPEAVAKTVVKALLSIEPESEMAKKGNYFGFSPPGDYTNVEAMLQRLHAHPDRLKYLDVRDVLEKYSLWLVLFLAALSIVMTVMLLRQIADKRRIRAVKRDRGHLLASIGEGVYGVDGKGLCTFVNKAALDILGFPEHEVLGYHQHEVFHHHYPDGRVYPKDECPIAKTIQDGQFRSCEEWFFRKDGSIFPVQLTVSKITGGEASDGVVASFQDVTSRKKAEEEITTLAFYDPLTALPNRRLLIDRLKHAIASSSRSARHGALLFLDLDNFKTLNDTRGHDIGDLLLQQVAQRLSTCVREGDTVARFGGDEFVVMLEDLSENLLEAATQTEAVGEKILATLNQPYQLGDMDHRSTASVGVTLFADHQGTMEELLKQADLAMYQSKAAGRNTLRFFDSEMQVVVADRAALEVELREAVRQQQFILYYQPQVDGDGRLTGAEALLRWQHPQRGMVSPAEFIPLAEETGLILPLGLWVLEAACERLNKWARRPETDHLTLAVNVSARQFRQPDFVGQVLAALDCNNADPRKLKLELTESMLLDDVKDIISKMTALKSKGVGFSLDDFGTGYSSLSYLKQLPLDQLKIDQSFVRNILTDPNDAAIAHTIVALAHSLGLAVIAEGVETAAQRDFLARNGCHAYQGYLFGRPMPTDSFEEVALKGLIPA